MTISILSPNPQDANLQGSRKGPEMVAALTSKKELEAADSTSPETSDDYK
jgi:hypothetical protein